VLSGLLQTARQRINSTGIAAGLINPPNLDGEAEARDTTS